MAMHTIPESKNNRLLLQGIQDCDEALVRRALDDPHLPANPNVYWVTRYMSALELAFRRESPRLVRLLVEAGADPLFDQHRTHSGRIVAPIFNVAVRHDPTWGPAFVATAQTVWKTKPPSLEMAQACVEAFQENHPSDRAFLDAIRVFGPELGEDFWWETALRARGTSLVDYVQIHRRPRLPRDVLRFLKNERALQDATAVVHWIRSLEEPKQAKFLVGTGDGGGLFAAMGLMSHVRALLWDAALATPEVLATLRNHHLGGTFLFPAMCLPADSALAWLNRSADLGVSPDKVRSDNAKMDELHNLWQGALYPDIEENDTLLDAHLRNPSNNRVSVLLCRHLVRLGCKPTFSTLQALCARMTYRTPERLLTPLFREWVRAGVDPDPSPGKTRAAWDSIRSDERTGIAGRLRAWHASHSLQKALALQKASTPMRRGPRM